MPGVLFCWRCVCEKTYKTFFRCKNRRPLFLLNKLLQESVFSFSLLFFFLETEPDVKTDYKISLCWSICTTFEPKESPTTVYFNKISQKIVFSFLKPNQTLKQIIKSVWVEVSARFWAYKIAVNCFFSVKGLRKLFLVLPFRLFLETDRDVKT